MEPKISDKVDNCTDYRPIHLDRQIEVPGFEVHTMPRGIDQIFHYLIQYNFPCNLRVSVGEIYKLDNPVVEIYTFFPFRFSFFFNWVIFSLVNKYKTSRHFIG